MIALLVTLSSFAFAQDDNTENLRLEQAVSTSRGKPEGVIVMWPRIMPYTLDNEVLAQSAGLQQRMVDVVKRASPLASVDRRPEPERVCPRDKGCRATMVGVLLGQQDGGCVAVGIIGPPEFGDRELFPLVGEVDLAAKTVPFRSPPENVVTVREFVPCSKLSEQFDDSAMVLRLREVMRQ